jgi:peroxiredoxin
MNPKTKLDRYSDLAPQRSSLNLLSCANFFIFNEMPRFVSRLVFIGLAALAAALSVIAQSAPSKPKEIFIDRSGNRLTNNEFVDLRLANPREKDPATRTVLDDGTVQFTIAMPRQEGTEAPMFEAPDVDAKWITADDMKGKVVVLNFWFIGCVGCMDEIPKLSALEAKYRDNQDVMILAIAPNTAQDLRRFRDREKFSYRLIPQAESLVKLYDFIGYPRNIVIGRDGKIVYWRTTVRAWDKFESVINDELAKK